MNNQIFFRYLYESAWTYEKHCCSARCYFTLELGSVAGKMHCCHAFYTIFGLTLLTEETFSFVFQLVNIFFISYNQWRIFLVKMEIRGSKFKIYIKTYVPVHWIVLYRRENCQKICSPPMFSKIHTYKLSGKFLCQSKHVWALRPTLDVKLNN